MNRIQICSQNIKKSKEINDFWQNQKHFWDTRISGYLLYFLASLSWFYFMMSLAIRRYVK
jgi:hypothetical protein